MALINDIDTSLLETSINGCRSVIRYLVVGDLKPWLFIDDTSLLEN